MNYQEALSYLYSFTDYERSGKFTHDRSEKLPRMRKLLELLGNPHLQYSSTLIAGTKGKGSTAAFIERVLRSAGVLTGLYTQPDLHTFRERIRINGQLIPGEDVAALIPDLRAAVEQVQDSGEFGPFNTYEVGTGLMFLYFARQQIQHAVLEVGLGGRLDATNVVDPIVSVITSISSDPMQVLGDTLTKIATEKAGIIKQNGMLVTSAQAPEALLAIAAVDKERNAHMVRVGPVDGDAAEEDVLAGKLPATSYRYRFHYAQNGHQYFNVWTPQGSYTDLEIPLAGLHQVENATTAVAALELLREHGIQWDEQALREGFKAVHWPGRIEVVGHEPTIVVDGAHNGDSMHKLIEALRATFSWHRLIVVLATNQDKDQEGIVRELAAVDELVLTRVKNPRATPVDTLHQVCEQYVPHVKVHETDESNEAMNLASDLAGKDDLICATGSLYLVGEVLRWAAARGSETAAAEIAGIDHP